MSEETHPYMWFQNPDARGSRILGPRFPALWSIPASHKVSDTQDASWTQLEVEIFETQHASKVGHVRDI